MLVMVSGGFDPIHKGHIRYIEEASHYGDVIVALNSDEWLKRKKGFVYMSFEDRKEILQSNKNVHMVTEVDDSDGSVCKAISQYVPDIFANGGDRFEDNIPEKKLCQDLDINMIFNVGGDKVESSSEIVKRNWGFYEVLHDGDFKVKILTVLPGMATSIQKHKLRSEHWIDPSTNKHRFIPKNVIHQLKNDTDTPMRIVEVQTGTYFGEDDIERL